jgi:hypothetical protein
MFASLRLRLTIAYFVVAGLLLGVVAVVGTVFVLSMYARATQDNVNAVIAQAPAIYKLVGGGQKPLKTIAPQIIDRLERNSVRITVVDADETRIQRSSEDNKIKTLTAQRPPTFGRRNDFWRGILFGLGGFLGMHHARAGRHGRDHGLP